MYTIQWFNRFLESENIWDIEISGLSPEIKALGSQGEKKEKKKRFFRESLKVVA